MSNLPEDELLYRAFVHAECDVEGSLMQSMPGSPDEFQFAKLLEQLEAYRHEHWPNRRTPRDVVAESRRMTEAEMLWAIKTAPTAVLKPQP